MTTNGQPIRVALADDHTLFRKTVCTLLSSDPALMVIADGGDGNELLSMLERQSQAPDVCLLDVNMPGMNGYDTLLALRSRYPDVKVLVLSMLDNEIVIIQMLRAKANGYLLKDCDPQDLLSAIHHVAREDFYLNNHVSGRMVNWARHGEGAPERFQLREVERAFLKACVSELSYKEIAVRLGLSLRTLENTRDTLCNRLDIQTRTGLALAALRMGLASL